MSEQVPSDRLSIKSSDWTDMVFEIGPTDNELYIEVLTGAPEGFEAYTWLTVDEAKRLRDWLNRSYP